MLKRPTHDEMDALLEKNRAHTLTLDEAYLLKSWIQRVYIDDPHIFNAERLIAILVLMGLNSLIMEKERAKP